MSAVFTRALPTFRLVVTERMERAVVLAYIEPDMAGALRVAEHQDIAPRDQIRSAIDKLTGATPSRPGAPADATPSSQ